jgi:histidinol-phosphate aminotransferase
MPVPLFGRASKGNQRMSSPKAKPYLSDLDTYLPGKRGDGAGPVIKLSSNENPNGPSTFALDAYTRAASQLHRYPEDGALKLREAIADKHAFAADQLICGAGSDDVIRMLCHAYAGAGDEVIYSAHGFSMYRIYAAQHGAHTIAAPEQQLRTDPQAVLAAVTERTKLVFLANPNNPTGSYLSTTEIHDLRATLREDIILVLDGAYAEYMTAADYTDGRELVANSNTVIMRTFSKAYGLSTLRIGWGYGPKAIIDMLYKVRSPFNITQASLDAAIAALRDEDYLQWHISENNRERAKLTKAITAMGLHVYPAYANFIVVDFASKASDANAFLKDQGIIVREIANYGLPECLRISVGTPSENTALISALAEWCA